MKYFFILLAFVTGLSACQAPKSTLAFDPDTILVESKKQPEVLLVGCFHFAYYNLDAHKVEEEDQKNVMSEQGQKEMKELVDYIARFKPTKIVVEAGRNTGYLMHRYREYKAGTRQLRSDEMEQLGFRMLDRFKLDTLYGCDDGTIVGDLWDHKDSLVLRPLLDSIYADWDFQSDDPITKRYKKLYSLEDSLSMHWTLLEFFRYMNHPKSYNRDFGAYLNGDFKLGDIRGADGLAMHWYARNLRILRHIQQITTSPDDRIMVIYGAGHMGILHHLFECTPEYKLVEFGGLGLETKSE